MVIFSSAKHRWSFHGVSPPLGLLLFIGATSAQIGEHGRPCSSSNVCPKNYFCDFVLNDSSGDKGLCRGCIGHPDECDVPVLTEFRKLNFTELGVEDCKTMCSVEKNSCSTSLLCPAGLFCNFVEGDSGYCNTCPNSVYALGSEPYVNMTKLAEESYWTSCDRYCHRATKFDVKDVDERKIETTSFLYSPLGNATGPLVDCGLGSSTCEGANNSICLIRRGNFMFSHKVNSCESGGGLAAIIYNTEEEGEMYKRGETSFEDLIPSISMSFYDGKYLVENSIGSNATVSVLPAIPDEQCSIGCNANHPCVEENYACNFETEDYGFCDNCIPSDANNFCVVYCSQTLPCAGEGLFCDYARYDKSTIIPDEWMHEKNGKCEPCPPEKEGNCLSLGLTDLGVEECTKVCGGSSTSGAATLTASGTAAFLGSIMMMV